MAEEDNVLAAWRLARAQGWSCGVISAMQGLRTLYTDTGRGAAWARLLEAIVPEFIDVASDGPRPGLEEEWSLVTEYRVHLARERRAYGGAERLQRLRVVDWERKRAQPALETAPETPNDAQQNAIRSLAVSVHEFAEIQRKKGDPACVGPYGESFDLAGAIGDTTLQGICAFNIGGAYLGDEVADLKDLDEAERWCQKSLELRPQGDALDRGKSIGELGGVALRRFLDARGAQRPVEEFAHHLAQAAQFYEQALEMTPQTAITDRGIIHNQLGAIYGNAGDADRALYHFRQDIRYKEQDGDLFGAGQTRRNVALTLKGGGRWRTPAPMPRRPAPASRLLGSALLPKSSEPKA
jgi:tetratricopeptide (TPR) repeat protein